MQRASDIRRRCSASCLIRDLLLGCVLGRSLLPRVSGFSPPPPPPRALKVAAALCTSANWGRFRGGSRNAGTWLASLVTCCGASLALALRRVLRDPCPPHPPRAHILAPPLWTYANCGGFGGCSRNAGTWLASRVTFLRRRCASLALALRRHLALRPLYSVARTRYPCCGCFPASLCVQFYPRARKKDFVGVCRVALRLAARSLARDLSRQGRHVAALGMHRRGARWMRRGRNGWGSRGGKWWEGWVGCAGRAARCACPCAAARPRASSRPLCRVLRVRYLSCGGSPTSLCVQGAPRAKMTCFPGRCRVAVGHVRARTGAALESQSAVPSSARNSSATRAIDAPWPK